MADEKKNMILGVDLGVTQVNPKVGVQDNKPRMNTKQFDLMPDLVHRHQVRHQVDQICGIGIC